MDAAAPRRTVPFWAIAALVAGLGTLFAGLGAIPLVQPDEGRNATVALEMAAQNEWLVPTLNTHPYLDKPALFFVLVGASLETFGANEAAARLPSALCALAVGVLVWAFARDRYGRRTAGVAACILATFPLFVAFARIVIFDMALTLFVVAAVFAGHLAESSGGARRRRWYLVGAAATGLATLVKGPVGFALPAAIHFASCLAERRPGFLRRSLAPANLVVFLALVVPWLVGVSLRHPDFLHYGVAVETLSRLTDPAFQRNQPFWFYGYILGAGGLPWTLLVPGALWLAWRARTRLLPVDRLCLVWIVTGVGLFSLSQSKQPAYVVNVAVPIALGLARLVDVALSRPDGTTARWVWWPLLGFAALLALASAAVGSAWLEPELLAPLRGIEGPPATLWLPVLPAAFAVLAGAALLVGLARLRGRLDLALLSWVALLPALLLALAPGFVAYAEERSSRVLVQRLHALPAGTEVACLRCFPSALPFYLGRSLTVITDDGSELRSNYVRHSLRYEDTWPSGLVRLRDLETWLSSREGAVYVLADEDMQAPLAELAARRHVPVARIDDEIWGALFPPARGS